MTSTFTDILSPLLQPFTAGSLTLRNRFSMAPMTTRQSPDGIPTAANAEFYRARAAGGLGLIIPAGTLIDHPSAGPSTALPRMTQAAADGWRAVVDAVHSEGSSIIPQLWHTGVERAAGEVDLNPDVPSDSPSGLDQLGNRAGRELTTADIDGVIAAFASAAALAKSLGFDGVQLHGAHGYLLDEFLWDRTNVRSDRYGGSVAARTEVPRLVVEAVREAVGPDLPIVFRFSQWKGSDFGARIARDPAELEQVLTPLAAAGVDIFDVSVRRHWLGGFPELGGADGALSLAGWTRRVTGTPVIAVGSVGVSAAFRDTVDEHADVSAEDRLRILLRQFEAEEFDVIALGRAVLADPEWVAKMTENRVEQVVPFVA